jgi:hypothetical protein
VLTRADIAAIGAVAAAHDLWIVVDEVYEELVFEGVEFVSPLSDPALAERVIAVSSISKSHAAPGLRSGWCIGPQAFIEALLPLIRKACPDLPNERWVALRLLNGDERIREAVRSGELGDLGSGAASMWNDRTADVAGSGAASEVLERATQLRWGLRQAFPVSLMEGLQAAGMPNVWCTGPGSVIGAATFGAAGKEVVGSYSLLNASIAEFFGTAVLLWGVLGTGDAKNVGVGANLGPLAVGFVVVTVGLTLGGPSGYSINPARDLSPRIFGALAGTQDLFSGLYWLIPPVLVPLLGGAFGCLSYDWLISPFLPTVEPAGRDSETEL